jgi:amidophosphoribosyltransferase
LAGIVAIYDFDTKRESSDEVLFYLVSAMRMVQHRGKAYWKMMVGERVLESEGSIPSNEVLSRLIKKKKLLGSNAIGYLSKRAPLFPSMNSIKIALDGFLVDTEKLYLHPYIGSAKDGDPLFQIYSIFIRLIEEKKDNSRAAEFLDRHLRGNLILKVKDSIFVFRNSTGFKPLIMALAPNEGLVIFSSENSLQISFSNFTITDVKMGQLLKITDKNFIQELTILDSNKMLMDPFEFIRESHVTSTFNNKSIYTIRRNIGKVQANYLSKYIDLDTVYAEPDYTRPMALGIGIELQKSILNFEISEGVIKDRYDDSDHMIDFSEEVSKNKLLTTGKSLKFILENITKDKKVASIQGTIQTGSTAKETIYYLNKSGVKKIDVIVSYVPTIDGRQVGLYTSNRDFIANKYMGKVTSLEKLNSYIANELVCEKTFYNSPYLLSKGIGVSESNLWFPEWIRFLDYE